MRFRRTDQIDRVRQLHAVPEAGTLAAARREARDAAMTGDMSTDPGSIVVRAPVAAHPTGPGPR
jgi:hypothetical protein